MEHRITRIDLSQPVDETPDQCLNLVRPGIWHAQNVPELAGTDLREVEVDTGRVRLKGPSSAIAIDADLRARLMEIALNGQPAVSREIVNATMRPGPWLINKLTFRFLDGPTQEHFRLDEDSFVRGDAPSVRTIVDSQDARWLVLRDAQSPTERLRIDLIYCKVHASTGGLPFREVADLSYDTAPNAHLATEISGLGAADDPLSFVRVGPRDWVEHSMRKTNGTLMRVTMANPRELQLTGPEPEFAVWRVNTEQGGVQGSWRAPNGTQSLMAGFAKIAYGPHRWRRGQRVSCRAALAADPFHGTGQPGAKAAHPHGDDAPLVYRTTIKMPPMARYADIRSVEEVDVDINHHRVRLDRTKHHRVMLDRGRMVTVTMPAIELTCPTLEVRASTMDLDDWHPIHPDVEVHKRLVTMTPADLRKAQGAGHLPPHLTGQQLNDLHATVTGLARTIQYTHNPKAHGVHRDRAVHAPNLVHPHFRVVFGSAHPGLPPGPTYGAFAAPQAQALVRAMEAHPGFKRIDNLAGQGVFDFFKGVSEAFVHTVEKVAGDFVDTATHVVKDVGETIDHVGEHLAHGDIAGVGKDLLEGGEHVGSDIGHGIVSAGGHVLEGAGKVLVMTLKAANEVFQFVLDHTGVVGEAIRWVLEKAGVVVGKFLRAFLDNFGWEDVLHTHDVIAGTLDQGLERMAVLAGDVKAASDRFFQDLIADLEAPLNRIIAEVEPHGMTREALPAPGHSKAMEALEWLFGQVVSHSPLAPAPIPVPKMPWQPPSPGDELGRFLHETFGSDNEIMERMVGKAVSELEMIADDIAHAPQHLFAALIEVVRDSLAFGLTAVSKLIDLVLDLAAMAFRTFRRMLAAELSIPVVSDFYEALTGRRLTMLSLVSLLVAIPATVIAKATLGRSPFAGMGVGQASPAPADVARAWGYTYASAQLALTVTAAVDDVFTLTDELPEQLGVDPDLSAGVPVGDPVTISKGSLGLAGVDLAFGLLAQITANPVTPDRPYELPHSAERTDPLLQANYWAHVVWLYQWGGFGIDVFTKVPFVVADGKVPKLDALKRAKDVIAVVNTLRGLVHLPLMVAINDGDLFHRDLVEKYFEENAAMVTAAQLDMVNDATGVMPLGQAHIFGNRRNLATGLEASIRASARAVGAPHHGSGDYPIARSFVDFRAPDAGTTTTREWLVEQRSFLMWAKGQGHDNTMPLNEKLFGNICDCVPEIGQVLTAPSVVDGTLGLSLIGSTALDVFGHLAESIAYFKRTAKDELL